MINLKGIEWEGNPLKIDIEALPKKVHNKPKMIPATVPDAERSSVFIGNLDFSITEQSILDMCEGILGPQIATRVRVAIDRDTGTCFPLEIEIYSLECRIRQNIMATLTRIDYCDLINGSLTSTVDVISQLSARVRHRLLYLIINHYLDFLNLSYSRQSKPSV